jgi:hypothetical protein
MIKVIGGSFVLPFLLSLLTKYYAIELSIVNISDILFNFSLLKI